MPDTSDGGERKYITIRIRRRAWYAWLGWLLWLILLVVFLEFALASGREYETQAAVISWIAFFCLLLGGLAVAYVRRKEAEEEEKYH